ncbi:M67 family metallopeptidase [Myxococcus sp. CA033]|uniref:Mov34/MPN/PAD-1 family protein n=1 Tax=Myxococcus sp. CA033 TaxID=2741516 RepID=UPI00157B9976|nr:M67 family metallopeptidase [Myxococcus sp. CA033]NTX37087.1 M67 family metallopeptidase [Myxococcus sp. CA033]
MPWSDPRWPEAVRREVIQHLESCYPLEGCGVILHAPGDGSWRVCPLRNASPRPVHAYAFAPEEWLAVCVQAETRGEQVVSVFHSHVDGPPTFSSEDRSLAAPAGHPLLPGVSYLIASVHRGCVSWVSEYVWRDGDFQT